MAQQGTQCTKRRKGMVSTVLLIIAAFYFCFFRDIWHVFLVMIVRGSTSTARSRKPGQNTVLAVISQAIPTIPG